MNSFLCNKLTLSAVILALNLVMTFGVGVPSAQIDASSLPTEGVPIPGEELARTVSETTGIAISPLLGMAAVGGWRYVRTGEEERGALPWFCQLWFWVPALVISLVLIGKDYVLAFVPMVKKPLDALEVFENKASGLLAMPVIMTMLFRTMGESARVPPEVIESGMMGMGTATTAILVPVFLVSFGVVWLLGHAMRVLILASPFGVLDVVLRTIQLLVMGAIVVGTLMHPYLGAGIAVVVILVAARAARWTFRLVVFGTLTAWDLLTLAAKRTDVGDGPVRGFALGGLPGVAARTLGVVETTADGGLAFVYRPWLLLPRRSVSLPRGDYILGKGALAPSLLVKPADAAPVRLVWFRPRYQTHEPHLQRVLGLQYIEDMPIRRGLRNAWAWVMDLVGKSGAMAQAPR